MKLDGVYDGSDPEAREVLEGVMQEHYRESAKDICNALLDYAVTQDDQLRENGSADLIDDKTVFIVKRTEPITSIALVQLIRISVFSISRNEGLT